MENVAVLCGHYFSSKCTNDFLEFISFYTDNKKYYPLTFLPEFKAELQVLKNHILKYWSVSECENYYRSIETYFCESKFAHSIFYLPKNITYKKNWGTKGRIVDLHWDESHVADFFLEVYGQGELERRKNWYERAMSRQIQTNSPFIRLKL